MYLLKHFLVGCRCINRVDPLEIGKSRCNQAQFILWQNVKASVRQIKCNEKEEEKIESKVHHPACAKTITFPIIFKVQRLDKIFLLLLDEFLPSI